MNYIIVVNSLFSGGFSLLLMESLINGFMKFETNYVPIGFSFPFMN